MARPPGNRPELPPIRTGLGADLGVGNQTRAVLLGTACLLLVNALLLSVCLTVIVLTDGASVGGPLMVIPLAVLLPTLAIMIPYAILLLGAAAFSQIATTAATIVRATWYGVARRTGRRNDTFNF